MRCKHKHPVVYFAVFAFAQYFSTLSKALSILGVPHLLSSFLKTLIPSELADNKRHT